jgi:hypothetical protein
MEGPSIMRMGLLQASTIIFFFLKPKKAERQIDGGCIEILAWYLSRDYIGFWWKLYYVEVIVKNK